MKSTIKDEENYGKDHSGSNFRRDSLFMAKN